MAHGQFEFGGVVGAEQILHIPQGKFHRALLPFGPVRSEFEGRIPQAPFRLRHQGLGPVASIDLGALATILRRLLLGFQQQSIDLLLAEVGAALDRNALLAARGAIGGGHLQQTIGIDVEGHLHLRHPPRRRRDAGEAEAAERLVALRHLALSLEHVDLHRVLVGLGGAEHIALAHRDGSVAGNQHLHHPTDRLQTQGEGGDIVEHQIAQFAGEDAGLHGSPDRHHLIGIHRLAGFAGDQGADHVLNHRHAAAAAHQHHVVDRIGSQARIPQRPLHRPQQTVEQIGAEGFKTRPLQGGLDVQGTRLRRGDEGQGNRGAAHTGQFDLGLLGRLGETLQRLTVAAQVDAVFLLEGIGQPVHDAAVPVVAAQLGVTAGGLHIEHAVGDAQHGNIEGATAQVEHQHPLHRAAIEAVGQGGGRGLIENAFHRDPRQPTGIAGGLALGIVEVGGHRDHRRLHRLPQIGGGVVHELAQDAGHELLGSVFPFGGRAHHPHIALVVRPHAVGHTETALIELVPGPPHKALEIGEGVARVEHQLAAAQLAHQQLLVAVEAHHRGGGAPPLRIGDHLGAATFEHGHHRVGGAQVDANDAPHECSTDGPAATGSRIRPHATGRWQDVKPDLIKAPRGSP